MTFLAAVSSPLPSSHVVYLVFFLNLATKIIFVRCNLPLGVSPGAVRPRSYATGVTREGQGQTAPGDIIHGVTPELIFLWLN